MGIPHAEEIDSINGEARHSHRDVIAAWCPDNCIANIITYVIT